MTNQNCDLKKQNKKTKTAPLAKGQLKRVVKMKTSFNEGTSLGDPKV